jgi:tetratricopeptide (TPR) repeat protein
MKFRFVFLLSAALLIFHTLTFSQQQFTPENNNLDSQTVVIDRYIFEAMLNNADRTITFLEWMIGVFSGVITILFLVFNYRDQKSLEKNRSELKLSQEMLEKTRAKMISEEQNMNATLEKMQSIYREYEEKISSINSKIIALETKSRELDKKTDIMNEITRYFSIAYQAVENKNFEDAVKYYSKILELNPDAITKTVVYNNRGIAYQNMGKNSLAIEDYTRVIALNPGHAYAYNHRGNAYYDEGEHELAMKDYSRAIEIKPDYPDAYFNRGNQYLEMKNYEAAVNDFTFAIELNPEDAESYSKRSLAYRLLGNKALAKSDLTKACELEPENSIYKNDLEELN